MSLSCSGVISGPPVVPDSDYVAVFVTEATGQQARAVVELTVNTGTPLDSTLVPLGTELYNEILQEEQNLPGVLSSLGSGGLGAVGFVLGAAETLVFNTFCNLAGGVISGDCPI